MSHVTSQASTSVRSTNPAWIAKRTLDVVVSFITLAVLFPLLLLIGLLIVVESGWPPLFTQIRVGKGDRRFKLYKFRTMVVGAEGIAAGLFFEKNDKRFTRVGKFLRRYSLDELPQLWNVLIGDESLVGPRAMVPFTADRLNARQKLRHRVRPGVTGLAQINGRNTLPWSKRVELDNSYIDKWSIWLDISIILRTFPVVLTSSGVRNNQSAADVDDLG